MTALSFVLLALFCFLLARWTWYFMTPKPQPEAPAKVLSNNSAWAAEAIVAAKLFGEGTSDPAEAAVTALNIRLVGVFAAQGSLPAFAIVNVDGKSNQAIRVGAEINPGIALAEVHPRYIVLRRNGVLERLEFEAKADLLAATPPANFHLNVKKDGAGRYSFSRTELNSALQDPRQLANLGQAMPNPGGGMILQSVPPDSLAAKLGLQAGDVMHKVNNATVANQFDLAALYQKFGDAKEIKFEGMRDGRPLSLNYVVQQ